MCYCFTNCRQHLSLINSSLTILFESVEVLGIYGLWNEMPCENLSFHKVRPSMFSNATQWALWLFAHFGIVQKQTNIHMVDLFWEWWFLCCMTYCIVSTLCIACAVLCSLACALTTVRLQRGRPQPSLHRRTNHREYNVHVGHIARPWLSVFILCAQCNLCNHIF